jgi:hypothetical protein
VVRGCRQGTTWPDNAESFLAIRIVGIDRQFERAQPKLLSNRLLIAFGGLRRRRADQSEGGLRKSLPDGEVIGRDRKPSEFEHVAAGIGHASHMGPGDLVHVHSGLRCQCLVIGDCPRGQTAAVMGQTQIADR